MNQNPFFMSCRKDYSATTSKGTLTFTSLCKFKLATYSPTNLGSVSKRMVLNILITKTQTFC
jgi:hypothetical protein